jgi:tetratricopeptide (TPR) repeat protein
VARRAVGGGTDWPRARRARAGASAGRVDEAAADLEIAVNLAPSDADAWRALGRLLAVHGGALEAERADEALRNALTLEPAWTDLRELRAQVARRRAAFRATAAPAARSAAPSEHARALFRRPRSGSRSAIRRGSGAICSSRRWPTRPASWRPR